MNCDELLLKKNAKKKKNSIFFIYSSNFNLFQSATESVKVSGKKLFCLQVLIKCYW
jgi:hypothetical protein